MRLAILADVHGNLPALKAVLRDMQHIGVAGVVDAGDFTGGPQVAETLHLLRSLGTWMIRGNREDYLIAYDRGEAPKAWYDSYQWACMRWLYQSLGDEGLRYITALPEQRVIRMDGTDPVLVVHGTPRSPTERLIPDHDPQVLEVFREAGLLGDGAQPPKLEKVLDGVEEPVVVCGHTHIPWSQRTGGRLAVNPGSVGAPLNGDTRAQYAILTWRRGRWEVVHRAAEYDLTLVRKACDESGYLSSGGAIARACLLGVETGQNVIGAFLSHVYELAAVVGYEGHQVVPDEVWEEAVESFNWPDA